MPLKFPKKMFNTSLEKFSSTDSESYLIGFSLRNSCRLLPFGEPCGKEELVRCEKRK